MAEGGSSDSFEQGDAYEAYVGRWSRAVARRFIYWPHLIGRRFLDAGCGTGAICEVILENAEPASVIGVDPSLGFLETAKRNLGDRAAFIQGSATAIPLADNSVDVVISGLMPNFVEDPVAALSEMARVTANGGTIKTYVWDYAGRMDIIRFFWEEAAKLDRRAKELDEGARFRLCKPRALTELFQDSALQLLSVGMSDVPAEFAGFDDYWRPFLGGQGPAPAYAMSLDEDARERLRENLQRRIPLQADGTISMIARAWTVSATVAK